MARSDAVGAVLAAITAPLQELHTSLPLSVPSFGVTQNLRYTANDLVFRFYQSKISGKLMSFLQPASTPHD